MRAAKEAAVLTAATLLLMLCVGSDAAQEDDCSTNFIALQEALLTTENNYYRIWSTFYHPRKPIPLFVEVTYKFLQLDNKEENADNSAVYMWTAVSIFLLQPPQVFGYTSLYLGSIPDDRITELELFLPDKCRILTTEHTESRRNRLEVLTHRLKAYAEQYDSKAATVSDMYFANAVDTHPDNDDLTDRYRNSVGIRLYISVLIGFPLLIFILVFVYAMGDCMNTRQQLNFDSLSSHASLAAITVTGFIFSLFVLGMDMTALIKATTDHEFRYTKTKYHSFDDVPLLWVTVITFALDTCFIILGLFALGLATCGCCSKLKETELKVLLLMGTLVAPIGCFGTHFGYIVIAWLSFPTHAGAVFLMYMISFAYYVFTFRQLYLCCINCWNKLKSKKKPSEGDRARNKDKSEICYAVIWVELGLGILIGGLQIWFVAGFLMLPINGLVENSSEYLRTFSTTVFVILSGLIGYKVLDIKGSNPAQTELATAV